ncbi:MAG: tyrosine-type recombinase/integrase [Clostridiales bacterium]|nr:tyrosine-type recombinase/integrase [Clostridiales bacterium]
MEDQNINNAIMAIMEGLKHEGKSPKTLKTYETSFNSFEQYLTENDIATVDENLCLEYIHLKTGQRFSSFSCVTANSSVDYRMRPLSLLLNYLETGQFHNEVRRIKPRFICPQSFIAEYEAFCEELVYRGYRKATIESNTQKAQLLITYLAEQGVASAECITIQNIEDYLKTLEGYAVKYLGTFLYVFRNFFSFLYERGYINQDLAAMLPKVRMPRNASIPYVWAKEDLQKLLGAVDRADPKGKRDYAILLIAIRLGLRISDIRALKQSSIDWNRKTINLTMAKTGQPIELPLLKDVGWAIIDYLQNGRPATNSECLFVRHKAPFNAFGGRNAFGRELHRYILKAGLNMPGNQHHGMHSLRSTLAGNMLDVKSPLPIISEALGHQSVNTTGLYLKIDIEGLRKCAIDPEEVFFIENTL